MTDDELKKIASLSQEIESILKNKFSASGKGLHQSIASVEKNFDEALIKDLRFIATIHNKSIREENFKFDNIQSYENVARKTITKLNSLPVSKAMQASAKFKSLPSIKAKSPQSKRNRKRKKSNVRYILIFVLLIVGVVVSIPNKKQTATSSSYIDSEYEKMLQNKEQTASDSSDKDSEYKKILESKESTTSTSFYIENEYKEFIDKDSKAIETKKETITPTPTPTPTIKYEYKPVRKPKFYCEGKTHCSHMSSCEEAKFYINNCPNTKMDGDGDGVPCERQWCH